MKRLVNFSTVVLSLGVLTMFLATVGPRAANAAVAALVHVDNFPATQPVSGTVAVSNLPGTQPVSGSVNVGNFPPTQLIAGTVNVANTPASPLYNRDVDNGDRKMVKLSFAATMNPGELFGAGALQDPDTGLPFAPAAGQRLVIDEVSIHAEPPPTQNVSVNFFNGSMNTYVPLISQGTLYGSTFYNNSMPMRDYVDAGQPYTVVMNRSASTGYLFYNATAVGHLVDCTAGGGC
jgi:hypothetical protein